VQFRPKVPRRTTRVELLVGGGTRCRVTGQGVVLSAGRRRVAGGRLRGSSYEFWKGNINGRVNLSRRKGGLPAF